MLFLLLTLVLCLSSISSSLGQDLLLSNDNDPSNEWSPQELKLFYSTLVRDKERAHWQPSRSKPLVPMQTTPLGILRHSSDLYRRLFEIPIHTDESMVERRAMKERRAGDALGFGQWGGMMKTMDNLRKPRFG